MSADTPRNPRSEILPVTYRVDQDQLIQESPARRHRRPPPLGSCQRRGARSHLIGVLCPSSLKGEATVSSVYVVFAIVSGISASLRALRGILRDRHKHDVIMNGNRDQRRTLVELEKVRRPIMSTRRLSLERPSDYH